MVFLFILQKKYKNMSESNMMGHLSNREIAKICNAGLCKIAPSEVTEQFVKYKMSVSREKDESRELANLNAIGNDLRIF